MVLPALLGNQLSKLFNRNVALAKGAGLYADGKLIIDGDGTIAAATNTVGTLTVETAVINGQTAKSGAGAISLTSPTCILTTTGANALTLANGTLGQRITIIMIVDGGDGTLTPATALGFTTIAFNDVGDTAILEYTAAGRAIVATSGTTVV